MAQLAPQEVKGERGKMLAGRKVLELSLCATGRKVGAKWLKCLTFHYIIPSP